MKRKALDKLESIAKKQTKSKTIKDLPLELIQLISEKAKSPIFNSRTDIGPLDIKDIDISVTRSDAQFNPFYADELPKQSILRASESGPITRRQDRLIMFKERGQEDVMKRTEQLILTAIFGKGHPVVEEAIKRNRIRFNDLHKGVPNDPYMRD